MVISNDQAPNGQLATASWGEFPGWWSSRSSYEFLSTATPIYPNSDRTLIDLGLFTHNNFAIPAGTAITSIGLAFSFGIPIAPLLATFNFSHNETPNDGSDPRDIVTITNPPINTEFLYDSDGNGTPETYYASLLGFSQGAVVPSLTFYTYEGQAVPAHLYATITEAPTPQRSHPCRFMAPRFRFDRTCRTKEKV